MENFTPVSSFLGGMLIGLSAIIMLLFNGRIAGISGILGGLIKSNRLEKSWRFIFLLGLMIGGSIFQRWQAEPFVIEKGLSLLTLILGGILIGLGTRMGNGCTSGHGICGLARFSKRSFIATLVFMLSGMLTATFIQPIVQNL